MNYWKAVPFHNKLSPKDVLKICALYKDGWRMTWIGNMYKVDHTTIIYHLKKHNVYQNKILLKNPLKQDNKLKVNKNMSHKVKFTYNEKIKRTKQKEFTTAHDVDCNHPAWIKRCSLCQAILESDSKQVNTSFGFTREVYNELDKIVCSFSTSKRLKLAKCKQQSVFYWVFYENANVVMLKTKLNLPGKEDTNSQVYAAYTVQELYDIIFSLQKELLTKEFLTDILKHSTDPSYLARKLINLTKLYDIKI